MDREGGTWKGVGGERARRQEGGETVVSMKIVIKIWTLWSKTAQEQEDKAGEHKSGHFLSGLDD